LFILIPCIGDGEPEYIKPSIVSKTIISVGRRCDRTNSRLNVPPANLVKGVISPPVPQKTGRRRMKRSRRVSTFAPKSKWCSPKLHTPWRRRPWAFCCRG